MQNKTSNIEELMKLCVTNGTATKKVVGAYKDFLSVKLEHKINDDTIPNSKLLIEVYELMRKIRNEKVSSVDQIRELKNTRTTKTGEVIEKGKTHGDKLAAVLEKNLVVLEDYEELIKIENMINMPLHNGFLGYKDGWFFLNEEEYKKALWKTVENDIENVYTEEVDGKIIHKIRRFDLVYSYILD